ncbi:MAG TPA: sulfotransferase domain-containing protein [Candidatus Binataceae bacterium]|nr:sulfotransferase domain-containing protein [Candidatus Binataceae bacterium]
MRLPDFIGVGPPRTGTTWLNGVLAARVGLPAKVKETDFFANRYNRGIHWYSAHFRHCEEMPVVGEFSPTYFHLPLARQRINQHLKAPKIICTLRDPVARLYSQYRLRARRDPKQLSLAAAIRADPDLLAPSCYAEHLEAWFDIFGRQNVYVTFYEDLLASPMAFVNGVCRFLKVPEIDLATSVAARRSGLRNAATHAPKRPRIAALTRELQLGLQAYGYHGTDRMIGRLKIWRWCSQPGRPFAPLTPDQELPLRERFLPDIERLERLLGCDLSAWKVPGGVAPGEPAMTSLAVDL